MAQAGPVTDVVQRLFAELKSKNEETRVKASFELYDNVLTVSRGTSPHLMCQCDSGSQMTFFLNQTGLPRSSSSSTMLSASASRSWS